MPASSAICATRTALRFSQFQPVRIFSVIGTSTAADGSYTINGLNPLQAYRVRARVNFSGANNFGTVFANNKISAGTADVITVPAGGTITIDFALAQNAGGIIGQVTDAVTHAPVSGVVVDVFDGANHAALPLVELLREIPRFNHEVSWHEDSC